MPIPLLVALCLPLPQEPLRLTPPAEVTITADDAGRPLAIATGWEAEFSPSGVRFLPVLGPAAPRLMDLQVAATTVQRGDSVHPLEQAPPTVLRDTVRYQRAPGISETWTVRPEGLWHRLRFTNRPVGDGDLVVTFALTGGAAAHGRKQPDGSHRFVDVGGGCRYGTLVGIDAAGVRVDGDVRLVPEGLQLVLPGEFVERATYPLDLDPLLGAEYEATAPLGPGGGSTSFEADRDAAVAYDQSTDRYLIAWQRTLASGATAIRAQLRTSAGASASSVLAITAVDTSRLPRVAGINASNRFGIAWVQDFFGQSQVRFRAVSASDGTLSSNLFVEGAGIDEIERVDIGGEDSTSLGVTPQVWIAFVNETLGVRCARVEVPFNNGAVSLTAVTTLVSLASYPSPRLAAIARSPSGTGELAVAWAATAGVFATLVDRDAAIQYAPRQMGSASNAAQLRVDGGGDADLDYVVAWRANGIVSAASPLYLATLQRTTTLTALPAVTLVTNAVAFDLAWRPGKAYIACCTQNPLGDQSISLRGVDPRTCLVCESSLALDFDSDASPARRVSDPTLCLDAAGGSNNASRGLVVWTRTRVESVVGFWVPRESPLIARRLDAFAAAATATDMGGGCGNAGTPQTNTPPAVGNALFELRLVIPSGSTLLGIANLASAPTTVACGPCQWLPFEATVLVPASGNLLRLLVPIPCQPSLAGIDLDTQWTVWKPGVGACPLSPDFALGNILRLAIR